MAILVKIPPKAGWGGGNVSIYREFNTGHWLCRCWMSKMQTMISRSKTEERVVSKDQKFADTSTLESKSLHLLVNCWRCHILFRIHQRAAFFAGLEPWATLCLQPLLLCAAVLPSPWLCHGFCCDTAQDSARDGMQDERQFSPPPPYKFLAGLPLAELDRKPVGKRSWEVSFADSQPHPTHRRIQKGLQTNKINWHHYLQDAHLKQKGRELCIHSFIQKIFIACLLSVRSSSRCDHTARGEQNRQNTCSEYFWPANSG